MPPEQFPEALTLELHIFGHQSRRDGWRGELIIVCKSIIARYYGRWEGVATGQGSILELRTGGFDRNID